MHHSATFVANCRSERSLLHLLPYYILHVFLSPVLVRDLVFHKLVKATRSNLVLPLPHHHSRLINDLLLLGLVPLTLGFLISNLLLVSLLRVQH